MTSWEEEEREKLKAAAVDPNYLRRIVSRWLTIRSSHGYSGTPTPADADHSGLLWWMMQGKEPLPEPPPLCYSYPWHALIVEGRGTAREVWEPKRNPDLAGRLVIEQSAQWLILEKRSDEEYIVRCETNGQVFRVYFPCPLPMITFENGTARETTYDAWGLERLDSKEFWEDCVR